MKKSINALLGMVVYVITFMHPLLSFAQDPVDDGEGPPPPPPVPIDTNMLVVIFIMILFVFYFFYRRNKETFN